MGLTSFKRREMMNTGFRRRLRLAFWRTNSTCTFYLAPPISYVLCHLSPDTFSRYFCVGISTAFSIVNNLDKLMVATKELVGEEYHIHGIGIVQKGGYEPPPTPGSTYPQTSKEV
jgi:hypothetical protein